MKIALLVLLGLLLGALGGAALGIGAGIFFAEPVIGRAFARPVGSQRPEAGVNPATISR